MKKTRRLQPTLPLPRQRSVLPPHVLEEVLGELAALLLQVHRAQQVPLVATSDVEVDDD